jgi:hypothetical protein
MGAQDSELTSKADPIVAPGWLIEADKMEPGGFFIHQ